MANHRSARPLLFLAGDFPPDVGGIQRYAYELVRAVVEAGRPCAVIAPARPGSHPWDEGLGCPVARVPGASKPALALTMGLSLAARLLRRKPAAVIATKWMPEGPACLLARAPSRVPLVVIGYGREFLPERRRPLRAWLQRRVLAAAHRCVCISRYTAGNLEASGVPPERIRVIYGGVEPDPFASPQAAAAGRELRGRLGVGDAPLLLTVSRLVRRKGHDLVLQALARLRRDGADVRYAVVGDGPEGEGLRRMAADLGVAGNCIFAGAVAEGELPAWYAACDAFVMPSRDLPGEPPEGLGLVFLEAGAAGKPVIGTRTGGVADAIADGETGLLVEAEDVEGLAVAVRSLIGDPGLAGRLGAQGRERVLAQFTWRRVAERFLAVVAEVELAPEP